jgi:hypothetical protein
MALTCFPTVSIFTPKVLLTTPQPRAYGLQVFVKGRSNTMAYFELQPDEADLQQLANQYWQEASERERHLEKTAFEAGAAIREGDFSLHNLETIVRWKSERVVHYLIANSNESIYKALSVAAKTGTSVRDAVNALTALRGIDLPIATAILAAIHPDRYAVLDYRSLEALGHSRHDVDFYESYLGFFRHFAECGVVKPQTNLPGDTSIHTLERALWEWSRIHASERVAV